jgi:hypothetical protein
MQSGDRSHIEFGPELELIIRSGAYASLASPQISPDTAVGVNRRPPDRGHPLTITKLIRSFLMQPSVVVWRPKSSHFSTLENLARFTLIPDRDDTGVERWISGAAFGALLADKAFDTNWPRADLNERGAIAVIPPKAKRKEVIDCYFQMYKWRHLI